jgi:hypothetical protein
MYQLQDARWVDTVIKLILAGALALGVSRPMGGLARDGSNQVTVGMVEGGPSWNDANAKMRFVRIAENAIVFHNSKKVIAVGQIIRPRVGRKCCFRLACKGENCAFRKDGGDLFWDFGAIVNARTAIHNNGMSDIMSLHRHHKKASLTAKTTFKIKSDSATLLRLTQKVGTARFAKGRPNQSYADEAQNKCCDSRPEHGLGPISRIFLRLQIPDLALIPLFFIGIGLSILGFKCFAYAADTRRDAFFLIGVFVALCGGGLASGVLTWWVSPN